MDAKSHMQTKLEKKLKVHFFAKSNSLISDAEDSIGKLKNHSLKEMIVIESIFFYIVAHPHLFFRLFLKLWRPKNFSRRLLEPKYIAFLVVNIYFGNFLCCPLNHISFSSSILYFPSHFVNIKTSHLQAPDIFLI